MAIVKRGERIIARPSMKRIYVPIRVKRTSRYMDGQ